MTEAEGDTSPTDELEQIARSFYPAGFYPGDIETANAANNERPARRRRAPKVDEHFVAAPQRTERRRRYFAGSRSQ